MDKQIVEYIIQHSSPPIGSQRDIGFRVLNIIGTKESEQPSPIVKPAPITIVFVFLVK